MKAIPMDEVKLARKQLGVILAEKDKDEQLRMYLRAQASVMHMATSLLANAVKQLASTVDDASIEVLEAAGEKFEEKVDETA